MSSFNYTPLQIASALLVSSLLVCSCSSSGSDDNQPSSDSEGLASGGPDTASSENDVDATETLNDASDDGSDEGTTSETVEESSEENDTDATAGAPDPLIQTSTTVGFNITVPAYVSDALQVRVSWGETDIWAEWIGDEFWSITTEFPGNTEHLLVITFLDDNGDITLGSFEQSFRTGSSDSEILTVTADQFDTDRWDSDNDGISNIDELIAGTDAQGTPRVLLFSETRDYRHDSIDNALEALEELAASADIQTVRAADSTDVFTESNLSSYDAVVWVLTSGDVLNDEEQTAFEQYIRSGGGYAGIHAASDTEYEWPWYGNLVGAYFDRHPEIQSASQTVENGAHASTTHLASTWTRTDEWYDYRSNPRAQVNVLLTLDEDSYSGGEMGEDHPSAWYHDHDGGRSWYTGGGHTDASYSEPDFRAHLLGGLRYAAGIDG